MVLVSRQLLIGWISLSLVGCSGTPAPTGSTVLPGGQSDRVTADTISITPDGFEPPVLTIKKGTTVTWTNSDQFGHWVASDPHPIHTDLPGFDAGRAIPSGETYQFTFQKVGEWAYHDHLRPVTYTGTIVVTE